MHHRLKLEAREKELLKKELLERLEALLGSEENTNEPGDRSSDCSPPASKEEGEQRIEENQITNPKDLRRYNGLLSYSG